MNKKLLFKISSPLLAAALVTGCGAGNDNDAPLQSPIDVNNPADQNDGFNNNGNNGFNNNGGTNGTNGTGTNGGAGINDTGINGGGTRNGTGTNGTGTNGTGVGTNGINDRNGDIVPDLDEDDNNNR